MITRIYSYLRILINLNLIKTIYINLKVLDWEVAIKFPIYIFGSIELANISGKVVIEGTIRRGMIHFGSNAENILATNEPCRFFNAGKLIFKGSCKFSKGVQLLVMNNAQLVIGTEAWIGSFTKIVTFNSIVIGDKFMSSWECQIFDTDFHFLMNRISNSVQNNSRPIHIGNNVWLSSRVSILKGTFLPNRTVVASSSLCNTDYSSYGDSIILGGVPAKLLKSNMEYIFDKHLEKRLFAFFSIPDNSSKTFGVN